MEFQEIVKRAMEVRYQYDKFNQKTVGEKWGQSQIMEGFVGDVGELMQLVMAKEGWREINDVDEKIKHELADCLWSLLVLANGYNINLEKEFLDTMKKLEDKIEDKR